MNTLKRFLIVSALIVSSVATIMACGPWQRPHYYMFSAYHRNLMGNTFTQRMNQFWMDYDPQVRENSWDIDGLSYVDNNGFDESNNSIIVAARKRNDKEMLDYLRLLTKYLRISNDVRDDTWSYPTKEDLARRTRDLKYINNCARSYGGTRLAGQYCLLVMRTQMVAGDHAGNINYWNNHKNKLRESVYKDMMKDIYAGALLNTDKTSEAAQIYYELGDMESLRWIMRDNTNIAKLTQEYQRDPNSPILIYLVQELTNVLSDTHYNIIQYNVGSLDENNKMINSMISLAGRVINEGKTNCPALWMSAMGWLNHTMGKSSEGIDQLNKAMKMNGTARMLDNARACRLVATAESKQPSKKLHSFMRQEMQWIVEREKAEEADAHCGNCQQNHYTEVLQNIVYGSMAPRFLAGGNANLAMELLNWMDNHTDPMGDYKTALDNLTSTQLIDYYRHINKRPSSEWEKWLRQGIDVMSADNYNDMVGTKMIREGKLAEAKPYLEKVSLNYLATQAIAPYSSVRNYKVEMCFKRQTNANFNGPIKFNSNPKLNFVNDMLVLLDQVETLGGERRAQAAYTLANYYLQASYKGNCWYLSRYGNSVNDTVCYKGEQDFLAQAARWYEVAITERGVHVDNHLTHLYAAAYLPYGEPYAYYQLDANYKAYLVWNRDSYQYKMLGKLNDFTKQHPDVTTPYVTRCDVLREFRTLL